MSRVLWPSIWFQVCPPNKGWDWSSGGDVQNETNSAGNHLNNLASSSILSSAPSLHSSSKCKISIQANQLNIFNLLLSKKLWIFCCAHAPGNSHHSQSPMKEGWHQGIQRICQCWSPMRLKLPKAAKDVTFLTFSKLIRDPINFWATRVLRLCVTIALSNVRKSQLSSSRIGSIVLKKYTLLESIGSLPVCKIVTSLNKESN